MSRDRELRYGVRGKSLFKYPTLKSLIFRRVCFFSLFFNFQIEVSRLCATHSHSFVFQKYHPYDHTSWGRSENKLLNYPSFTSVCTKYGLYYSIVIILYNANVLLIGQFIWFQDSITLFYYLFSSNDAGTGDHDRYTCIIKCPRSRVASSSYFSSSFSLVVLITRLLLRFIFIFLLLLLCLLRLRRARRDSNTTSRTVLLHPGSNNRCYFCGK